MTFFICCARYCTPTPPPSLHRARPLPKARKAHRVGRVGAKLRKIIFLKILYTLYANVLLLLLLSAAAVRVPGESGRVQHKHKHINFVGFPLPRPPRHQVDNPSPVPDMSSRVRTDIKLSFVQTFSLYQSVQNYTVKYTK